MSVSKNKECVKILSNDRMPKEDEIKNKYKLYICNYKYYINQKYCPLFSMFHILLYFTIEKILFNYVNCCNTYI